MIIEFKHYREILVHLLSEMMKTAPPRKVQKREELSQGIRKYLIKHSPKEVLHGRTKYWYLLYIGICYVALRCSCSQIYSRIIISSILESDERHWYRILFFFDLLYQQMLPFFPLNVLPHHLSLLYDVLAGVLTYSFCRHI